MEKIAFNLGCKAFHNGKPCIPALDKDLLSELLGLKVGEGAPLLRAWIRGWTKENLDAPLPE